MKITLLVQRGYEKDCCGEIVKYRFGLFYHWRFYIPRCTAALNEKWDRDFSEPKRWIYVVISETDHGIICPECRTEYSFSHKPTWGDYQFCPHCGQGLLPPKE